MRALAVTARGVSPEVVEVPSRSPGATEVLVGVSAASINGFDLAVAAGYLWDHMPHAFPVVLGRDFAGTVEAVGDFVGAMRVGDRVAGVNTALELGPGPLAESFTVDASNVTRIPDGVDAVQAAAVGLAGITALDLIHALDLVATDTVLVAGATGGVGAFAVQLAAASGARVLATARPGKAAEFVRSLGAEEAVDFSDDLSSAVRSHSRQGVTKTVHAAGDPAVLGALLNSAGRLASAVGATASEVGRSDVTVEAVMAEYTPNKLGALLAQVAAGQLIVPIAATYQLANAADALTAFRGGKLGKLVVTP
jgi:NADPH:quinone reductase-like Zn-dependent oxidoreductase